MFKQNTQCTRPALSVKYVANGNDGDGDFKGVKWLVNASLLLSNDAIFLADYIPLVSTYKFAQVCVMCLLVNTSGPLQPDGCKSSVLSTFSYVKDK